MQPYSLFSRRDHPETRLGTSIPSCGRNHKQTLLFAVKIAVCMARKAKVARTKAKVSAASKKKRGFSLAAMTARVQKSWNGGWPKRSPKQVAREQGARGVPKTVSRKKQLALAKKPSATAGKLPATNATRSARARWRRGWILAPAVAAAMLVMAPVVPRDRKPAPTIPLEVAAAAMPRLFPITLPSRPAWIESNRASHEALAAPPAARMADSPKPIQVSATQHRRRGHPVASLRRHRKRYASRRHSKDATKTETRPCPS